MVKWVHCVAFSSKPNFCLPSSTNIERLNADERELDHVTLTLFEIKLEPMESASVNVCSVDYIVILCLVSSFTSYISHLT